MQQVLGAPVTVQPQTAATTIGPAQQCIVGQVQLFRFFTTPAPGSVIGQVTPLFGSPIPLIQTRPTPFGGIALASVDRQFAVLCGRFVIQRGQIVFDVLVVNPGAPSPTGTPQPINQQLLLLLLFLSLLGGLGIGAPGLGQFGIPGLGQQFGIPGLGQQFGVPGLGQQFGIPGLGQQFGIPGLSQQLGIPGLGQQFGVPVQ